MTFDRTIRLKKDPLSDPLNAGIRKALRGETVTNDESPRQDEWSLNKILEAHKEAERIQDERESGAWPM
jgi:hypothetical protein